MNRKARTEIVLATPKQLTNPWWFQNLDEVGEEIPVKALAEVSTSFPISHASISLVTIISDKDNDDCVNPTNMDDSDPNYGVALPEVIVISSDDDEDNDAPCGPLDYSSTDIDSPHYLGFAGLSDESSNDVVVRSLEVICSRTPSSGRGGRRRLVRRREELLAVPEEPTVDNGRKVSLVGRQLIHALLNRDTVSRLGSNSGANDSPPPLDVPLQLIGKDPKAKDLLWEDEGVSEGRLSLCCVSVSKSTQLYRWTIPGSPSGALREVPLELPEDRVLTLALEMRQTLPRMPTNGYIPCNVNRRALKEIVK
ncbi:hypothetical protein HYC85_001261 [Camellia sinensis]|uniref:Uncharacterized protein n=1 Tax=Camellia sinensis TaxID=4442 RepID=A0A7J7I4V7_CAMSI|nr:hypothetical protein HYC85_001261 [Camellia sinensis]